MQRAAPSQDDGDDDGDDNRDPTKGTDPVQQSNDAVSTTADNRAAVQQEQRIAVVRRRLEATSAGRAYADSDAFAAEIRTLDAELRSKAADALLADALLISGSANLQRWLAERLGHRGDHDRAKPLWLSLSAHPSHAVVAQTALGEMYEAAGDEDNALAHYERVLAIDVQQAKAKARARRLRSLKEQRNPASDDARRDLARVLGARAAGSRYAVIDEIGRGGAAAVYRAHDRHLNRELALKIFHPRGHRDDRRARLLEEARIAGGFVHPHVVPILDVDEQRDVLAMVLCNGGSLQRQLSRGVLRPAMAVELGGVLLRTLADVHDAGHLHLDIKPSNLLFHDDQLMLCDFGSAGIRALGGAAATRAYMAPEQVSGDGVGPATDLFAVALVIIECMEGALPDRGQVQLNCLPRSPRRRALEQVLQSMVQPAPAARPVHARAAATALLQAGALPSTDSGGAQLLAHVENLARRSDGFRGSDTLLALRSHPSLAAMVPRE